jgi:hypothetical protein
VESPWGMVGLCLLVTGAVALRVLPLTSSSDQAGAIILVAMLVASLGALLFAFFGRNFRWGRTNIPMSMWLGRLLMGVIALFVLYSAWRLWQLTGGR